MILNQKLSPRIKNAIRGYKHDSLKGLIANLLNIYDCSESHHEAFSAIVNQKSKFTNLHDFTEETLRLLSLSRKNSDHQSQLFVHSVQHILPKRVFEKLLEFLDSYEIIHKGKYPELPTLVDFIYKFKSEVDAHMAKNYKGPKYHFAQTNESENEDETNGNNSFPSQRCSICNKNNHSTENVSKQNNVTTVIPWDILKDIVTKKRNAINAANRDTLLLLVLSAADYAIAWPMAQ